MVDLSNIVWIPEGDTDERRTIIDVTPRVKSFSVHDIDNLILGHHYHVRTHETFYVVEKKTIFKLEDIETKERAEYELGERQAIKIPLFVAHVLIPERNSKLLAVLEEDFDPTDCFKYEIKW